MQLELPPNKEDRAQSNDSDQTIRTRSSLNVRAQSTPRLPIESLAPPIFSILVICPLEYSREATVQHLEMTLPKSTPHHITARKSLDECLNMLWGDDPVIFTHVVLVLHETSDIITIVDQVLRSRVHTSTSVVVISDLVQKRAIMQSATYLDIEQVQKDRRVRYVFKPLKPSKLAYIFDPQKEREMSQDRNHDSAQQVAVSQKQLYEEMKKRLGNRGLRVLLVEDNKTNQMVSLRPPDSFAYTDVVTGAAQISQQSCHHCRKCS